MYLLLLSLENDQVQAVQPIPVSPSLDCQLMITQTYHYFIRAHAVPSYKREALGRSTNYGTENHSGMYSPPYVNLFTGFSTKWAVKK